MVELAGAYYEIAAILAIAAAIGVIGLSLKQPLIISFIAAGILVGPVGLNLVSASEEIEILASIGIAVLLFVVGLRLDLNLISSVGPVALATGLGQVLFTSLGGFLLALALGLETVPALYVAVALTFSSTIIIVKLLSDKREIDSLHGRIAVGFLIVQDIVVVLVMIALSAFAGSAEMPAIQVLMRTLLVGAAFVVVIAALMRWVLPRLLERLAKSQELLVLFAIAWAVFLAAVGEGLGFSKEVGAFLGGVSIASTPYREAIASRLVTLRDFLILFFFIELGGTLDVGSIGGQLVPAVVLSVFVLVGNPIIVVAIMGFMGYRRRTGFLSGLAVAQISEFSLILVALGFALGHIGSDTVSLVTVVGLVTIGLSTYLILYSHRVYELLERPLRLFERKSPFREIQSEGSVGPASVDYVVFGLGRYGLKVGTRLVERGYSVLGVDFDPVALKIAHAHGLYTQYGDAADPELTAALPMARTKWVVLATPAAADEEHLVRTLRHHGFEGKIAVTAHTDSEVSELEQSGADLILKPFADAADQAVDLIAGDVPAASLDRSTVAAAIPPAA